MDLNEKNITMADIADAMGVSLTTVSRALSGNGRVGNKTRNKIIEYANSVGFKPNVLAQSLAKQRTGNIALVVPSGSNLSELPYFQNSMQGVCGAAEANEYDVIVSMRDGKDYTNLKRLVDNHKIDGIILSRSISSDEAIHYLKQQGVPFLIMGTATDKSIPQVDNDHVGGCCNLTQRFLMSGRRRIGIIGGDSNYIVNQSRLSGYRKAFRIEEVVQLDEMIHMDCTTVASVQAATIKLLEDGAELIIGMDDIICSSILEFLKDRGVSVPKQIQVACFYDSTLLRRWETGITALSFDDRLLGETAFRMLMKHMEDEHAVNQVLLGHQIINRGSTRAN